MASYGSYIPEKPKSANLDFDDDDDDDDGGANAKVVWGDAWSDVTGW